MQPLRQEKVASTHLRLRLTQLGAQYMRGRSTNAQHIYFSRRLNRWIAVSNAGRGTLWIRQYAQCPCGATA